ncbi:helix-turn-helix domain-containing protein [Bacillus cereus]|uniref:helix-turn-helix domain-containing protein n=1 Tax=Bacillus cereus TaxID=1396 RepID=UPI0035560159|nr:helix-turn-helix domain-containing protein [Bacillus cereus]
MANKKTKQRKKRLKRQLQKRIKQITIVGLTFRELEDMRVKEQTDLHMKNENEKLDRTSIYQRQLDAVYGGIVKPIHHYINPKASILHHCSECHKEWYARPMWLLTKDNQKHICGVDPVRMSEVTKKNKPLTEMDKLKMYDMAKQGISASKIATELGVSRTTITKHLKKAEESKVLI